MEQQPVTSKQYFKTLSIIYYTFIVGQILLIIIAFTSQYFMEKIITSYKIQGMITILMSFLGVLGFFAGKFLFKNDLKKISAEASTEQKMQSYKSALIKKYSMLEFISLCAAIATFLTGENIFLTFSLIIVLLFFIDKPSAIRAAKDLALSPEDSLRIQKPDEMIA
jgi:hypothetical protein